MGRKYQKLSKQECEARCSRAHEILDAGGKISDVASELGLTSQSAAATVQSDMYKAMFCTLKKLRESVDKRKCIIA